MATWETDEFMSQWDRKYVSTNLKPGSKPYDKDFFLDLESRLASSHAELKHIANTLIV